MTIQLEITNPQDAELILSLVRRLNIPFQKKSEQLLSNGAKPKQRMGFGSWKGIRLSADFDTPLEDFKEYME